ncbi:heme o synthase [Salinispira pacifica]
MRDAELLGVLPSITPGDKLRAYFELTKPRIATLILIVAMASFFLASGDQVDVGRALITLLGTAALAAGIFALNHFLEREWDALMKRTVKRPLPSHRLTATEAFWFGTLLSVVALVVNFVFINTASGLVALFTLVSYLFVYTPLKRRTAYHTALGALSGATPPLLGWAAATGTLPADAWILFGVLFFWQFPHFLSIDMMYREDYERAGMLVLPVVDRSGRAVHLQIVGALGLLAGIGILPYFTGLAGPVYLVAAIVLGAGFLAAGIYTSVLNTKMAAKRLLRASVIYLPLLFIFMLASSL